MTTTTYSNGTTLATVLWPQRESGRTTRYTRYVVLTLAGALLLTLCAKLRIPFWPVPLTMQTLAVLLIGAVYGPRLGVATVLAYLAAGAAGLPVFAGTPEKGLGLAYMAGPTGGYLAGFVLAAWACGLLAHRGWDRRITTTALAMLIGNLLLYAPGLLWLGALFGWDQPILAWGLYPFLIGDLLKLVLATALLPLAWKWVGAQRRS